MKRLITAAALSLLATSAFAWDTKHFSGDICVTSQEYVNGKRIVIVVNSKEFRIGFGAYATVKEGSLYTHKVVTSDGKEWQLAGKGIGNGTISFPNLNRPFVEALVSTKSLEVSGLGKFNMSGSSDAIKELIYCVQAMKGKAI